MASACLILQALPLGPKHNHRRSLPIVHAHRSAIGVAECELPAVAMQVPTTDVMERTDDAALEKREEAFRGVGVDVALRIHAVRVLDGVGAGASFEHGTSRRGELLPPLRALVEALPSGRPGWGLGVNLGVGTAALRARHAIRPAQPGH